MKTLTDWEAGVLQRFVDAYELQDHARRLANRKSSVVVSRELGKDNGYIEFESNDAPAEGPYELSAADSDGIPLVFLLFVVDGEFAALEYFRADGGAIQEMPSPESLVAKLADA